MIGLIAVLAGVVTTVIMGIAGAFGAMSVLLLAGLCIRLVRRYRIRRRKRRESEDVAEAALLDAVAQEIANCYGHGPLAVMDPAYQHEFRRDARAAIKAMRQGKG